MNDMTTPATAHYERMCSWATNSQILPNVQITTRQQNGSTQTCVKRDCAFCWSLIDGIAQRPWLVVVLKIANVGRIRRDVGKKPTGYPCRREQEERDDSYTGNSTYSLCSTGTEKCH